MVIADPLMTTFSDRERNIVKWASLFHNLGAVGLKWSSTGQPHPFKAAASILDIFNRYNFLQHLDDEIEQAKLAEIIEVNQESDIPYSNQMLSHHNLYTIFQTAWTAKVLIPGSPADTIFRLVLFH